MRALLVSLLLAAALPVLVACGAGVERVRGDDDDDTGDPIIPALDPCSDGSECSAVEVCVDGLCHLACSESAPCLGDRRLCDAATGACVSCLLDEQCADGETCDESHECVAGAATTCTPNELGCLDDNTAFVCASDGNERIEAPCREDQFCEAGVCRTLVCTPGSVVCSGNARVICDEQGTDTTIESCDDGCADGGFGCSCVDGIEAAASCQARSCAPGEARCVGNAAQRCDADGLSFGALEDCALDSCIAGRCLPDLCTPGTSLCSGHVLLLCDADGQGYDESTCAQACLESGASAQCADQVCVPLSQQCSDGETLSVCNANGTDLVTQPCGANKFCEDGVCQNEVCTPNARSCIGDATAVCNALGSDETVAACPAGDTCEAGQCVDAACVPQCGTRSCGPDPVCGASCGSCAGTCSSDGACVGGDGPLLVVELSWTPSTQDMDLYLTRDADGVMCIDDACSQHTCTIDDSARPDWNNDGQRAAGDPLLVAGPATNPERIELQLSGTALPDLRVGGDNFGPVATNGTAAATTATIRLRLDGALVATHARSVPVGANWKGVSVSWDGSALSSTDLGTIAADFACTAPAGTACTTDSNCPAGQGCASDGLFGGTCAEVECVSDDDCSGFLQCNGNHACALPLLVDWKQDCRNGDGNTDNANCHVGFHCDFFTQVCEEACAPAGVGASSSCVGVANCCVLSGGDTCLADGFLGVTANCQP